MSEHATDDVTRFMRAKHPAPGRLVNIELAFRDEIEWPAVDENGVEHYFIARLAQICPFHFVQTPGCVNPWMNADCGAQWPAKVIIEKTTGWGHPDEDRARGRNTWGTDYREHVRRGYPPPTRGLELQAKRERQRAKMFNFGGVDPRRPVKVVEPFGNHQEAKSVTASALQRILDAKPLYNPPAGSQIAHAASQAMVHGNAIHQTVEDELRLKSYVSGDLMDTSKTTTTFVPAPEFNRHRTFSHERKEYDLNNHLVDRRKGRARPGGMLSKMSWNALWKAAK